MVTQTKLNTRNMQATQPTNPEFEHGQISILPFNY